MKKFFAIALCCLIGCGGSVGPEFDGTSNLVPEIQVSEGGERNDSGKWCITHSWCGSICINTLWIGNYYECNEHCSNVEQAFVDCCNAADFCDPADPNYEPFVCFNCVTEANFTGSNCENTCDQMFPPTGL